MELMAPEEYQERQDQRWSPLLVLQCLHVCCTKWQGVIFVSGRPRVWRPPWSSWRKRAQGEFEDGNGGCGGRAVGLQTSLKLQSGTSIKALTLSLQQIWGWRAVQRLPPAISCALQIWQISEPVHLIRESDQIKTAWTESRTAWPTFNQARRQMIGTLSGICGSSALMQSQSRKARDHRGVFLDRLPCCILY